MKRIVATIALTLGVLIGLIQPADAAESNTAWPVNMTCLSAGCEEDHFDQQTEQLTTQLDNGTNQFTRGVAKSNLLSNFVNWHPNETITVQIRWRAVSGLSALSIAPKFENPNGAWQCDTAVRASGDGYATFSCTVWNRADQGNVQVWTRQVDGGAKANIAWIKMST